MSLGKEARGTVLCADASPDSEIAQKKIFLSSLGLWNHAQDFVDHRVRRQPGLRKRNPLYLHTTLDHYMQFHDEQGVRLPIRARNTSATLSSAYSKFMQGQVNSNSGKNIVTGLGPREQLYNRYCSNTKVQI